MHSALMLILGCAWAASLAWAGSSDSLHEGWLRPAGRWLVYSGVTMVMYTVAK